MATDIDFLSTCLYGSDTPKDPRPEGDIYLQLHRNGSGAYLWRSDGEQWHIKVALAVKNGLLVAVDDDGKPIDKAPWQGEPDLVTWVHEGLSCLIDRQRPMGHLCGYVRVPKENQFFGLDYDALEEQFSEGLAHGGITYARAKHPVTERPDGGWWFGFDAAHAGDLIPAHASDISYGTYRDMAYMKLECSILAEHLAKPSLRHRATSNTASQSEEGGNDGKN